MDWFAWLGKTSLEPTLIYEYGLAFGNNELEEEDIVYFNHEFLQSMGISIAKHRLEIIKLARKEKGGNSISISQLLAVIKKSKRCLSQYLSRLVHREESALVVVTRPRPSYGSRLRGALLKRNKKLGMVKQGRLMLTNGCSNMSKVSEPPAAICFGASPMVYDKEEKFVDDDDDDEGYWSSTVGVEEIRWDAMFQDLKPT